MNPDKFGLALKSAVLHLQKLHRENKEKDVVICGSCPENFHDHAHQIKHIMTTDHKLIVIRRKE